MKNKILIYDVLWISVSAILTAIAVNFFFSATGLAPGGITGLSIIFSLISGAPVDITSLCISIPLLVLGIFILGKNFGMKTLYITFATPLCMRLIPMIDVTQYMTFLPHYIMLLFVAIAGGLLVGSAIGIALNRSCATGGTDLIALLVQYFIPILKVPKILLVLDGGVVIASGFINNDMMIAVFSFISLLIIIQTIKFFTEKKIAAPSL